MALTSQMVPTPPGQEAPTAGLSALFTLAMIVIVVSALYFGRDLFIPIALAVLLSFALAPPVRWLRKLRLPNLPAVLTVVAVAFMLIVAFCWVVAWQAADLAQQLPTYRQNIEAKIDSVRQAPPGGRLFERATEMVRDIGRRLEVEQPASPPVNAGSGDVDVTLPADTQQPIPVEIHEPALNSMQIISTIVGPLVSPLATMGIVIVFVIFMLLRREDLRDRLIRLAGPRDLPRTTQALDDAARRVGRYLIMQLVVNTTYAIPIGIGLWLIGIPNAILWAMLCGVLRFVPYIGPFVAAFFPLALAVAVDPGWTTVVLCGALFIVIELVSNNLVEPWLYGASTGLSAIAIIIAAVFWTWLWGPIGLLLSTPLTVCLVVLGRHVPQLAFLDVLLGNTPVLTRSELLYQRLLRGDPNDATEHAEEFLRREENSLANFYDEVGVPALALAEHDRAEGLLAEEQRLRVVAGMAVLVDNLSEWEDTPASVEETDHVAARASAGTILCAGARGDIDDAAAALVAHLVERQGGNAKLIPFHSLQTAELRSLQVEDVAVVVISYMNPDSIAHARFLARRLRRRFPGATMIFGFWTMETDETTRRQRLEAIGVDRLATTLAEAIRFVVEDFSPAAAVASAPVLSLTDSADRSVVPTSVPASPDR